MKVCRSPGLFLGFESWTALDTALDWRICVWIFWIVCCVNQKFWLMGGFSAVFRSSLMYVIALSESASAGTHGGAVLSGLDSFVTSGEMISFLLLPCSL